MTNLKTRLPYRYGSLPAIALALMALALLTAVPASASGADATAAVMQAGRLSGKVTDVSGRPLIGAAVIIMESTTGVTTDTEGNFSIDALPGQTLLVTYMGYKTVEITLGTQTTLDVTLHEEATDVDEIVVVGYGQQRKVNLTGAVGVVDKEVLIGRPVASAVEAIQGSVPGLIIQQHESNPGNDPEINIRGLNTMNNNNPLVLIDGIEGNLNNVAMGDIEQISVLKDAASTAIYGSRASNGIILITTSKGSKDRNVISYDFNYGWQSPTMLPNIVDSWIYAELYNEAMVNSGNAPRFSADDIRGFREDGPNYKWIDHIYKTSPIMQHTLSASGGNDRTTYLISGNYVDQASMWVGPNYGLKKYNARINFSHQIKDYLKVTTTTSYTRRDLMEPSKLHDQIVRQSVRMPPWELPKDEDDNWTTPSGSNSNAFARLWDGGYINDKRDVLQATIKLDLDIMEGLTVSGMMGGTLNQLHRHNQSTAIDYPTAGAGDAVNSITERMERYEDLITNITVNYNKSIGKHNFQALAGYSYEGERWKWFSTSREYDEMKYEVIGDASSGDLVSNSGGGNAWALYSIFGRLNYNYDERYLFEFNIRDDMSSRFAKGNRTGIFPSFSAGWRISEEAFFGDMKHIFPNLKLRGSWGLVGNNNISLYQYLASVSVNNNYIIGGQLAPTSNFNTYNRDIKWETTRMLDVGLDVGMLNNRLNITFDYFHNMTRDILVELPVSAIFGSGTLLQNAGKVKTWGWEFLVNYKFKTGDFHHNVTANLSDSQNKVVDNLGVVDISGGAGGTIIQEGYPLWSYYGYKYDGIFQNEDEVRNGPHLDGITPKPGDLRYVDKNGDGFIKEDDDRFIIGNRYPRYTYGLTYSVNWKGIDFMMFWQGVGKRDVWLYGVATEAFANNFEGPVLDFHLDRWTPNNPNASYPRLTMGSESNNNSANSDFWIENAAYLRLKNVQLGYTFPQKLTRKVKIDQLRIYGSVNNALTFSKMRGGWDPETSQNNAANYAVSRVVSLGLNVKF